MGVHQTTKPHRMEYRGKSCRYMMSSPSSLNTHFHSLTPRSLTESGCNKKKERKAYQSFHSRFTSSPSSSSSEAAAMASTAHKKIFIKTVTAAHNILFFSSRVARNTCTQIHFLSIVKINSSNIVTI